MSNVTCPITLHDMLAWWLGEGERESQEQFEEHLFACAACSARMEKLAEIAIAIRGEMRTGHLSAFLPAPFIERMKNEGVRVREYRMGPGGSINCTITPQDDFVVTHLEAPLTDVSRLDAVIDEGGGSVHRLEDVAFDPASDGIVLFPAAADVRKLGVASLRVELIAVSDGSERVLGLYTLNHSPSS